MLYDVIEKKQKGLELNKQDWQIALSSTSPIEELSALLMAIKYMGLSFNETTELTEILANSGTKFNCFNDNGYVDLHSTGGVGDKCTLIACPIVASLGMKIPKMAGRSLGNTGGTIDKLEKSFDNINLSPTPDEFISWVNTSGFAITEQTNDFTPLDGKLYALRSRTATAECLPLIASSIMSKKIAMGCPNIVLNVTYGNGALMKTPEEAKTLAETMVAIGENLGKRVKVVYTSMDYPLGKTVGNKIEVYEAIKILSGEWQTKALDVSLQLAEQMLELTQGRTNTHNLCMEQIRNGKALQKFQEFIETQGGIFAEPKLENVVKVANKTATEVAIIARESDVLYDN